MEILVDISCIQPECHTFADNTFQDTVLVLFHSNSTFFAIECSVTCYSFQWFRKSVKVNRYSWIRSIQFIQSCRSSVKNSSCCIYRPFVSIILNQTTVIYFIISSCNISFAQLNHSIRSIYIFLEEYTFGIVFSSCSFIITSNTTKILLRIIVLQIVQQIRSRNVYNRVFLFYICSVQISIFHLIFYAFSLFKHPLNAISRIVDRNKVRTSTFFVSHVQLFNRYRTSTVEYQFSLLAQLCICQCQETFAFSCRSQFDNLIFPVTNIGQVHRTCNNTCNSSTCAQCSSTDCIFASLVSLIHADSESHVCFTVFEFEVTSTNSRNNPLSQRSIYIYIFRSCYGCAECSSTISRDQIFAIQRSSSSSSVSRLSSQERDVVDSSIVCFQYVSSSSPSVACCHSQRQFVGVTETNSRDISLDTTCSQRVSTYKQVWSSRVVITFNFSRSQCNRIFTFCILRIVFWNSKNTVHACNFTIFLNVVIGQLVTFYSCKVVAFTSCSIQACDTKVLFRIQYDKCGSFNLCFCKACYQQFLTGSVSFNKIHTRCCRSRNYTYSQCSIYSRCIYSNHLICKRIDIRIRNCIWECKLEALTGKVGVQIIDSEVCFSNPCCSCCSRSTYIICRNGSWINFKLTSQIQNFQFCKIQSFTFYSKDVCNSCNICHITT